MGFLNNNELLIQPISVAFLFSLLKICNFLKLLQEPLFAVKHRSQTSYANLWAMTLLSQIAVRSKEPLYSPYDVIYQKVDKWVRSLFWAIISLHSRSLQTLYSCITVAEILRATHTQAWYVYYSFPELQVISSCLNLC